MENNKLLKGAAILVGAYAFWFFWRERKESKAIATEVAPAETNTQILQKIVTTNPIPKAPIMLSDLTSGAQMAYDKVIAAVKGFSDPILNSTTPTAVVASTTTTVAPSTTVVTANVVGSDIVGADALVNQTMPSKKMMGFKDNSEGDVSGLDTASIQNYCKCNDEATPTKSILSKLKF
jgi:hypothetical protein